VSPRQGFAPFLDPYGGDDQGGDRVGAGPAEGAVEGEPGERHRRQVGARQGLLGVGDRSSGIFVPIVIALSVATLGDWPGIGEGVAPAFTAAVAVLIIACPCALEPATSPEALPRQGAPGSATP